MSGRVLVVDDEPHILRALKASLRGAGYEVETADTAEGALTAVALSPPDAVILDLVLPDGRGTDVTREVRTWSTVPVIVLSVVGDESEKVAALDAGADDYVTKPFGVDELLARLRAAMRRVEPSPEPVYEIGDLRVDLEKQAVSFAGRPRTARGEPPRRRRTARRPRRLRPTAPAGPRRARARRRRGPGTVQQDGGGRAMPHPHGRTARLNGPSALRDAPSVKAQDEGATSLYPAPGSVRM